MLHLFATSVRADGIAPTMAEIGRAIGVGRVTVYGHFLELERKGLLTRLEFGKSRNWALVVDGRVKCPCCGQYVP